MLLRFGTHDADVVDVASLTLSDLWSLMRDFYIQGFQILLG